MTMKHSDVGRFVALGFAFSSCAWAHADTLSGIKARGEFLLGHRESSSPIPNGRYYKFLVKSANGEAG